MGKYFGNTVAKFTCQLYCFPIYAKDDLYIGTDIGVYHKDSTMTEWQLFNNGLPHVSVRELEIQYTGKIRLALLEEGSGKVT